MAKFREADTSKKLKNMSVPMELRSKLENIKNNYGVPMQTTMKLIAEHIGDLKVNWEEEGKQASSRRVSDETKEKMAQARGRVKEKREIIESLAAEGMTTKEIAKETDTKETTVDAWTGRAQARVMDYLMNDGNVLTSDIVKECSVTRATAEGAVRIVNGDKPTRFYKANKRFMKWLNAK